MDAPMDKAQKHLERWQAEGKAALEEQQWQEDNPPTTPSS